jgi:predicted permease
MTPPRFPRWLLRRVAPAEDRAALIGDLDEEFRARTSTDRGRASRGGAVAWYWRQALGSLPSALRLRWQRAAPANDLSGDVRRALRMIRRQPAFAGAAIATMALGAGITTAVVSIGEAILIRPLPYENAGRVMVLQEHDLTRQGRGFSWADFKELSALQTFSSIGGYSGASRTLTGMGPAERVPAIEITPGFLDVLGVRPALGRGFTDADTVNGSPFVVVLSDPSWRRRFNEDATVIGRTITLSGVPHTVVGVLPRGFSVPPRGNPELWVPLRPSTAQQTRPYLHFLDVIGLRRPDVPLAAVTDDLRAQSQAWNQSGHGWHAGTTLGAVGLRADMTAGVRPAVYVLLGAALLVLLTSAINVSGLVLARASARTRELAVRSALGASRWRVARQLGIEALCIAVAGSALGLLIGSWAVTLFSATTPLRFRAALPYADQLGVSFPAAAFSVAVTVIAVLAVGLVPAFRAGRPSHPLLTGARSTAGRAETRLRRTLVAAQIALAVVLLMGAALIGRSLLNLTRVSPGFDIEGLVAGRVNLPAGRDGSPEALVRAVDRLLESVRAVPGVQGAEAINQLPLSGRSNTGDFSIVGRASTPSSDPLIRDVTPGYFRLMGIPILEGRSLQLSDTRGAPRVVVINRTLAGIAFADRSPIGQRIVFEFFTGRPEWTIVGIVGDERFDAFDRPMSPVVYFPFAQDPEGAFSIVVRATAPDSVVPAFRAAVAAVDPELPLYGVQTLVRTAADSSAMFLRAMVTRLLTWFAFASLLLGGVGVYGVLSESIAARTKEIGLRLALGATRGRIAGHVLATGLRPAAAGLLIGMAGAAAAGPLLRNLLFGIAPFDLPSFAAVAGLLAVVTLVACAVPAWRAVRLSVIGALRQE